MKSNIVATAVLSFAIALGASAAVAQAAMASGEVKKIDETAGKTP